MGYRDINQTSEALVSKLLETVQKVASAPRSEHADLVRRLVETMDDYVDARIADRLDSENNRGDYSRY